MRSLPMACPRQTRFRLTPARNTPNPTRDPYADPYADISIDDLLCRLLQPGHCRTLQLPADHQKKRAVCHPNRAVRTLEALYYYATRPASATACRVTIKSQSCTRPPVQKPP